jgi:hypothetical protein
MNKHISSEQIRPKKLKREEIRKKGIWLEHKLRTFIFGSPKSVVFKKQM